MHLETVDPLDLYGAKCSRLDILKRAFPKIQIVARGHDVKLLGAESQYYMASIIGILVFLVVAIISLVVYNLLPSIKNEEDFQ